MSELSVSNPTSDRVPGDLPPDTEQSAATPVRTVIRPDRGWNPLQLRELCSFRDLLLVLAGRDVKLRYKQTALGVAWVLLQPLLGAGIFALVFGVIAKLPTDGIPPFIFSYAGLLAWGVFSSTLTKTSNSLVGNSQLVSKVYFPRMVLPLSTTVSSLIDFTVGGVVLAILLAIYGIVPGVGLLLLPVWVILLLMFSVGIGLMASALMVSYRDVAYILPVLVPFLLYASPVGYSLSAVPDWLRPWMLLNPLTGLLEGMRWSILNTPAPSALAVSYAAGAAFGVFLAGATVFKQMERRFADVI